MDIQVLITSSTTDSTGPFNIIGNPGNVTIATGQTKNELVAGKTFTGISELITEITVTDTGVCNQAVTRSVIGAGGTTPTPTPSPYTEYTGSGRGTNISEACNDASSNGGRTFYSDCASGSFGVGCYVYVDQFPNVLTGYNNVQMNGATWDINSSTGVITASSSVQC
jgi:hypothetical protein